MNLAVTLGSTQPSEGHGAVGSASPGFRFCRCLLVAAWHGARARPPDMGFRIWQVALILGCAA